MAIADNELVLGISADPAVIGAEKYRQALDAVRLRADGLQRTMHGLDRSFNANRSSAESMAQSSNRLNTNLYGLTSAVSRISSGFGVLSERSFSAARGMLDVGATIGSLASPAGLAAAAITAAAVGLAALVSSGAKSKKTLEENSQAFDALQRDLAAAREGADTFAASMKAIARLDAGLPATKQLEAVNKALAEAEERIEAVQEAQAHRIDARLDLGLADQIKELDLGRRAALAYNLAVEEIGKFDTPGLNKLVLQIGQTADVTGLSARQFERMLEQVKEVERRGGISAQTFAELERAVGRVSVVDGKLVISSQEVTRILEKQRAELEVRKKALEDQAKAEEKLAQDRKAAAFVKALEEEFAASLVLDKEYLRLIELRKQFLKDTGRRPTDVEDEQLRAAAEKEAALRKQREERAAAEKKLDEEAKAAAAERARLTEEESKAHRQLVADLESEGEVYRRIQQENQKRRDTFEEQLDLAGRQVVAMGLEKDAAAALAFEYDLLDKAKKAGLEDDEDALARIDRLVAAFRDRAAAVREDAKAQEENADRMEELRQKGEELGAVLARSLERAAFEGGEARDVIKGLIQDLAVVLFRQNVSLPIITGIGNLFAGGPRPAGFFTQGGFRRFDLGGILPPSATEPSPLPSQRGRIVDEFSVLRGISVAEGGRATPELVAPLERDRHGRLGVVVAGAGGGTQVLNFYGVSNRQEARAIRSTMRQEFARMEAANRAVRSVGGRR